MLSTLSPFTVLKLIFADIRGNRRFCLWFIINLAIGLFGFAVIDVIKEGLSEVLFNKAREINGSDLEIAGRKPLDQERWQQIAKLLNPQGQPSSVDQQKGSAPYVMEPYTSLYSMVEHGEASLLVRVNGIGARYPLYGTVALEGQGNVTGKMLGDGSSTWLTKEVAERLKIKAGDTLTVAGKPLKVAGIISQDSSTAIFNNRLAPEIYTARSYLSSSGLLTKGSIANYRYQFRYPASLPGKTVLDIKNQLTYELERDGYRVSSYQDRDQPSGRVLLYTADFLSLVSLMAFFLSCLGCGYLFYGYFQTKIADIGIFKSLGASNATINGLLLGSALLLALLASAGALGVAGLLSPLALSQLESMFGISAPHLPLEATAVKILAMAIVCSVMISAPILALVRNVSPAVLLGNQLMAESSPSGQGTPRRLSKWTLIGVTAMILTVIYGFSLWQSESLRIGTAFFGTFLGLLIALTLLATAAVAILTRWPLPRSLNLRLALCRLRTEGAAFAICVVALGLGMTIVQAIHHIKYSIQQEMAVKGSEGQLPGLFLFDIQDDQYDDLQGVLAPFVNSEQTIVSPMVRGKFAYLPTREDETRESPRTEDELNRDKQWQRQVENRGVNLSFRDGLSSSEQLIAGRLPKGSYQEGGVAEITIEKDYARRLNLAIGDKLGFEVSGFTIDAKIVGLRKVKWNSFQPNFFIQVQKGVLDDFPKTYVAAIAAREGVTKQQLQDTIMTAYPTISIIDVDTMITKLLDIVARLIVMLNGTAGLALLAGLVVMVSIISSKLMERQWDINLMKILGGKRREMFRQLLIDYGLLSVIAASTSLGLGMIMAYSLITILFDATFSADWQFAALTSIGLIVLFVAIALIMTENLIRKKPSLTINQSS